MFTRPTCHRRAVTTLLTVWMTAVSLGVWVRHAHADSAAPHVHGWGWCPAGCPTARPPEGAEPGPVHRHLVFCGLECPNDPPADGETPAPADGVSVIDHPCERPEPADLFDLKTALSAPLPLHPASDPPLAGSDRPASAHLPLSAFARRLVSGVLRS